MSNFSSSSLFLSHHVNLFQDQGISFDRYENQGDQPILLDAQLRKDRIQFFLASKAPPDSILDLIFEV